VAVVERAREPGGATPRGMGELLRHQRERVRRIVLVSAVAAGQARADADIEVFRSARERFSELGVLVVDWLQCDGNVVRSIDLAADGEGWQLAHGGRLSA